ncbi:MULTISPECIES: transcription termination factor NusA [unclassified Treponema]|uniref:transcription termination factor NusA n=1 Tax=unclassified Treponema TaxID=2638727 RepID=UPI0020A52127|nr:MULTISPECIES: transcription termination factor NusA [unclassified Treponema]UTC65924.1 transcription termination/antitermination protein NusA [Treponema sp. OMZ 789]UTC68652.1 transcription termination/antitermination protein NusA [Treponema sp. OMZ 790]UTC71382.1 transcription termination/antitermination protein NusA [Treponema sp. OMZ 791]
MSEGIIEAIREFAQEKGIDDDFVLHIVEQALKASYKKQFGTDANAEFNEETGKIYSKKIITEQAKNPVFDIALEEAKKLAPACEIGDELLVEVDPKTLGINSVRVGMQRAIQCIREMQKDSLYAEYSTKVGEIIIGYYHRERNGNIYVDLGKVEGLLPKKYQSPRDHFGRNAAAGEESRIKALVREVKKHRQSNVVQLILSRTDTEFVKQILELEVPEIESGIVKIHNIVREPGYRTKISVSTDRDDIDPVGACVGAKGARIQAVIAELDDEKIDILPYSEDPKAYIKSALSPAEVMDVMILDAEKRLALAIVSDSQLSLAIGKQGLNVRLANRLVDWNIDVKTEEQFKQMDIYTDARKAVENLFTDEANEEEEEYEEISNVSELPGITEDILTVLYNNKIEDIQDLINMEDDEIRALEGLTQEMADTLLDIIANAVEVVEDDEDENNEESEPVSDDEGEAEEFECPECGHKITIDMTKCPNCGVDLAFEYEDEE